MELSYTVYLQITFDPAEVKVNIEERLRFWDGMRPWFQQHGYGLYTYLREEDGQCSHTYPQTEFKGVQEWPFAYLGGDTPDEEIPDFASWAGYNVISPPLFIILHFIGDSRDVCNLPKMLKADTSLSSWSRAVPTNIRSTVF